VINLNVKPKKLLPEWQTYSVLYYKDGLGERIRTEWKQKYLQSNPGHDPGADIPSAPIAFRNDKTREYFEDETEDVKERVKETRKATPRAVEEQAMSPGGLDDDEELRVKMLASYQR
jgi:hypothetical protein